MPLHPSKVTSRERIMGFGGANSGKSYIFYNIAKWALKTGSDAKFYITDTDVSVGRMLENPDFESLFDGDGNLINIEWDDVDDWSECEGSVEGFHAKMRPQDWHMIDMVSPTWTWCQDHFAQEVFHKDLADYFLQKREAMREGDKKLQAFEGWKDYTVINPMYGKLQNKMLRCPGHLYVTAEAKAISGEQAEKDTKALFGPHGVVPVGQKRNPHLFQTVLWFREMMPDERSVVTVKDRSREKLEGVAVKDFTTQYLMKIGGWKLS